VPDTTMQDAAMVFWHLGYHTIPTIDKEAAEKWRRYQTRQPTDAEIRKWWPPGSRRNLAVLLGPRLRLLCLNVNMKHGHDGQRTLRREEWSVPPTPTILTPHGGFAYLFRVPDRERYPFPFKTHQAIQGLPGLELRGEGSYQLVPPSQVDATTRDPAGRYEWQEPWTPAHLNDRDLADLPDWLLTLWITTDRSPSPSPHQPPNPLLKSAGQSRLHTVVVSKDATTVCNRDTTTVCSQTPEGGSDQLLCVVLLRLPVSTCWDWESQGFRRCCATVRPWRPVLAALAGALMAVTSCVHYLGMSRQNLLQPCIGMTRESWSFGTGTSAAAKSFGPSPKSTRRV
jgi:hypothetical protein